MILMLVALLAISAGAVTDGTTTYYGEIPLLTEHRNEIRLDGVKDSLYNLAPEIAIDTWRVGSQTSADKVTAQFGIPDAINLHGTKVAIPGVATGSVFVVFDGEYLWVFAEITDDDLDTKATDALHPSYKQDGLEFVINWNNSGIDNSAEDIWRAMITHEGYIQGGLKTQTGNGSVDDGGDTPCTWLDGYAVHTATGYNVEMRIVVPTDQLTSDYISLNFMLNDYAAGSTGADANTRVMTTSEKHGGGDWYASTYGYMKFAYSTLQPSTGDNGALVYVAVAVVVAAVAAVGIGLSFKKRKTEEN